MHKIYLYLGIIFFAFLGSLGQISFKKASESLSLNLISLISNYWLIIGLIFYGLATLGYVFSLKHGELSILYPLIASSYIFVLIFSWKFLGETMNIQKIVGTIGIILSVGLINYV